MPPACTCGHVTPKYPGSTACTECGCVAYEAGENDGDPAIADGEWPNVD